MLRRLSIVLLALVPLQAPAGTRVTGTILGSHGAPLRLAHAHIIPYRGSVREALQSTAADTCGRFALDLSEPGIYRLCLTGVGHEKVSIPLLLQPGATDVCLVARLAPLEYKEQFALVRIIGDWNKFRWETADTMERQADGTFLYERLAEADTVAYQLLDIATRPRSVNGTSADYFLYDGSGDYISVMRTRQGKARIVFDPQLLIRTSSAELPLVQFRKGGGYLQSLWEIDSLKQKEVRRFQEAAATYSQSHRDMRDFSYDWSVAAAKLKEYMAPDNEQVVREFAAVHLAWVRAFRARIDSAAEAQIVALLPASSPMWSIEPQAALLVYRNQGATEAFAQALLRENPDRAVRAIALAFLASMVKVKGDSSALAARYAQLRDEYGDMPEVEYFTKSLNPAPSIAKGKPVPNFVVRLMDTGQTVSDRDLRGKYYLLDFWATWCGPCIGEMPHLHAAFERFKDKGFAILSLSLDRTPDDVAQFRRQRWPMPWMHAFLTGGFDSEIARAFEVVGIPCPILVGPDGLIVETEETLRGEGILVTLAKYLGN